MPSNSTRESKAISLVAILGILGGLLVIIGFFLPWVAFGGASTLIRVQGLDNKPIASVVEQNLGRYLNKSVSVTITSNPSIETGRYGFDADVGVVIPDIQDNALIQFINDNVIPRYTPIPSPTAATQILVRAALPSNSGWDLLHGSLLFNFFGGVLALFGGTALAFRVKKSVYVILLGGILAVLGMAANVGFPYSYGYFVSLIGAVICATSGVVGLKLLSSTPAAKGVKSTQYALTLIPLLGSIGGILVIFGFFLPWEVIIFQKFTGWDLFKETSLYRGYLFNLLGGVLVLLGGTALAFRMKNSVYIILVGGILAVLGIHFYISSNLFGYYVSFAGSILCVITGVVGVRMLPAFMVPKRGKKIGKKVIAAISAAAIALTLTSALALHDRIEGGPVIASRIYLKLEASQVTLKLDNVGAFAEIEKILKDNELPIINVVSPYDNVKRQITVEIGQDVTNERIENLIDNLGQVISITEAVSSSTLENVAYILSLRVDPHGTIGTNYTSVGSNLIRFEVGLPLENAIKLLDLAQGLPVVVSIESAEQLNPPT